MFFHSVSFQRREFYVGDFPITTANIDLYLETYKPIAFTFVMMIDSIKVCNLMVVYMTLTVTEDHMFTRKSEFLQSFCYEAFS